MFNRRCDFFFFFIKFSVVFFHFFIRRIRIDVGKMLNGIIPGIINKHIFIDISLQIGI